MILNHLDPCAAYPIPRGKRKQSYVSKCLTLNLFDLFHPANPIKSFKHPPIHSTPSKELIISQRGCNRDSPKNLLSQLLNVRWLSFAIIISLLLWDLAPWGLQFPPALVMKPGFAVPRGAHQLGSELLAGQPIHLNIAIETMESSVSSGHLNIAIGTIENCHVGQ